MDGDALILLHPKGGISVPAAAGLRSQHQFPLQTTTLLQTTSLPLLLRSASMPKQELFDDKKPKARKQSNSPTPKLNLESI